ncbi:hypothetical protein J6590_065158 [Homalodisca vitripennis]|nr:hypothetical protein J6590_065158 [Homalodisca vitripennis]
MALSCLLRNSIRHIKGPHTPASLAREPGSTRLEMDQIRLNVWTIKSRDESNSGEPSRIRHCLPCGSARVSVRQCMAHYGSDSCPHHQKIHQGCMVNNQWVRLAEPSSRARLAGVWGPLIIEGLANGNRHGWQKQDGGNKKEGGQEWALSLAQRKHEKGEHNTSGTTFLQRKLIEATYIKLADQPISQPSVEIRPLWLPILKNELKRKPKSQYGFKKFISHEPIITKGPIPVPLPFYFRHLVLASRDDYHWLVPLVSRRWLVDE